MRPGQLTTTEFESAILQRLAHQLPPLKLCVANLHVLSREFTGVGTFTHFQPSSSLTSLPDGAYSLDVLINMPGVPNGMGAALFIKDGYADFLETFTFGSEHWDGMCYGFSIQNA
jgi:hypothetical protein